MKDLLKDRYRHSADSVGGCDCILCRASEHDSIAMGMIVPTKGNDDDMDSGGQIVIALGDGGDIPVAHYHRLGFKEAKILAETILHCIEAGQVQDHQLN